MFPILNPLPTPSPYPSLWVISVHQPQASSIMHQTWTGNSFHIWYYTCFNAILPNHPTLSLSHRVQKSIVYICVYFARFSALNKAHIEWILSPDNLAEATLKLYSSNERVNSSNNYSNILCEYQNQKNETNISLKFLLYQWDPITRINHIDQIKYEIFHQVNCKAAWNLKLMLSVRDNRVFYLSVYAVATLSLVVCPYY